MAFALGVLILAVAAAAGGYLLGRSSAPSKSDATAVADRAREAAEAAAFQQSYAHSKARGRRDGLAQGKVTGRRAGVRAARAQLAETHQAAQQQSAAKQTACPTGQVIRIQMGQKFCGPPVPTSCPPGQTPVNATARCEPDPLKASPKPSQDDSNAECVSGYHYTNDPPGGCVPD